MGVAEGRRDEEHTAGDAEIRGHAAARDHALEVGERAGKKRGLQRRNQQAAVAQRVGAGVKGQGCELLRLQPVEGLAAQVVEAFAETLLVG